MNDLANGPEGPGVKLVEMCRGLLKGQYYGGPLVDNAVNAVYAALIWNSQECREELAVFGKGLSPSQTTVVIMLLCHYLQSPKVTQLLLWPQTLDC